MRKKVYVFTWKSIFQECFGCSLQFAIKYAWDYNLEFYEAGPDIYQARRIFRR